MRFYLQEKEDPHGSNVSVFVSNLPVNLTQRQYERVLLRLLGAEGRQCERRRKKVLFSGRPFTKIGPIYYEYGSLVLMFDSAKAASAAVLKLQNIEYEGRKLLIMCLPNIHVYFASFLFLLSIFYSAGDDRRRRRATHGTRKREVGRLSRRGDDACLQKAA